MKLANVLSLGVALMCCFLATNAQAPGCKCMSHNQGKCDASGGTTAADCKCTLPIGAENVNVDCTKLIPKCLLMKKESLGTKAGRRPRPEGALIDNDGLYNPECDANGMFKARQCNYTSTCWCVNSAGVRRTDKGDENFKCTELVRTYWVIVQMKRITTDVQDSDLKAALTNLITNRYKLPVKYISNIEFEDPLVFVDLKQNSSEKVAGEVDIADVGYYMEKDLKGDPIIHADEKFAVVVNGKNVILQDPLILYIDEKAHEISMKRLTAGVIAVIVVVVLAIIAGIVVLVLTRRKKGRYEKAEMKEMNEMQRELTS
ncbi:epithelial cell adhesion molecule [Spea bombifrons]|uniref:epithelial cell adhesion molecule n=1 Tax=Spea bombifrons TaxID=233779 RepID=UPI00234B29AB|nr:epithelial cell adhesion molecule [Spea bombifrons]